MLPIFGAIVIILIIAWLVYKLPDWLNMDNPFRGIIQVIAVVGGVMFTVFQLLRLL